jgi:hypothetical protein
VTHRTGAAKVWLGAAALTATVTGPVSGAASPDRPPVALVLHDPATGAPPYAQLKVTRDNAGRRSDTALQPCDKVEFLPQESGAQEVRIATLKGGKLIVLSAKAPTATLPCDPPKLSEVAARLWLDIVGDRRHLVVAAGSRSVPAATRSARFELPVLASPQSNLVSGKRSLLLSWTGGRPPYSLKLVRVDTGATLLELEKLQGSSVRLPELNLMPGQYRLAVFNSPIDGSLPGLQDDQIYVVDPSALPAMPAELKAAKLSADEIQLLYAYYLEGLLDGRWTLEAMQRIAALRSSLPAAADWLKGYGASE